MTSMNRRPQKGKQVNAYRSPLSRLRAAFGARRVDAGSAFAGAGAPTFDGSSAPAGRRPLAFGGATLLGLIGLVVLVLGSAAPAQASGECANEPRREEQGAAARALPDCRAYELVTKSNYAPAPASYPFYEGKIPFNQSPGFNFFETEYSPDPVAVPSVRDEAWAAREGNAVVFQGAAGAPNSENYEPTLSNMAHRTPNGWVDQNIYPIQGRHAFFCSNTDFNGGSASFEKIAVRVGGGGSGYGDWENCGYDYPRLVEGEPEETANLFVRSVPDPPNWQLVNVTPPGTPVFKPGWEGAAGGESESTFHPHLVAMSSDGSHVVFASKAHLTPDAPNAEVSYLAPSQEQSSSHCDLPRGNLFVWSGGAVHTLVVPPDGIPMRGMLGGARQYGCETLPEESASFTNAVSANGERVVFNAGGGPRLSQQGSGFFTVWAYGGQRPDYIDGGLYLRENAGRGQSALAHGGAAGTGTLTEGSNQVSSLRVTLAKGWGELKEGSNEVTWPATLTGEFVAGQTIEGPGIPPGTTITAVEEKTVEKADYEGQGEEPSIFKIPTIFLSNAATESYPRYEHARAELTATSQGPDPFAVGQTVVGKGIPVGTTITGVAPGQLTLSNNATESAGEVTLEGSSACTESGKACTVQIDLPEAGASGQPGSGNFVGANAETTKLFFTDKEQLTTDSTAAPGEPDLYEYDVGKPEGQRLTDLSVDAEEPADVLGFAGASRDGSYVYFVAKGILSGSQQNSEGAVALGPASGEGSLVGPATGQGDFTAGSNTITNVTGGPFRSGEEVTSEKLPASTVITSCEPDCAAPSELTVSHNATGSATGAEFNGKGSKEVTEVSTSSGILEVGMGITGPGIPAHSWITEIGPGTLTLSSLATESGTQQLNATAANLYLRHGGTTTFIANLNAEGGDQCDWTVTCLTSRVSDNGAYVAFNSIDSLTGYDNRPIQTEACSGTSWPFYLTGVPGSNCMEAYRYAAASGELTCATCNPNGRPEGEIAYTMVAGAESSGDRLRINYPLSNSGQLAFETLQTLVPGDENNTWDVYEYSGGEGPTAQYNLISTGKSEHASEFLDASPDGKNILFYTVQSILRSDVRVAYDIYDARVDGGFVEPEEIPCEDQGAEACRHGAQTPPTLSTPSSRIFESKPEGPNHLVCEKHFVLRHGHCVSKRRRHRHHGHHKHHGHGKHGHGRAARNNRRAGK